MGKKKNSDQQNNKEPWSKKFSDEKPKNNQYTRSARKAKSEEVAPLYKVIFFLFLAILIIPFATIYWNEQTKEVPEPKTPEQVMVNKKGTSSIAEKEKEEEKASEEKEKKEKSQEIAKAESKDKKKKEESIKAKENEVKPEEPTDQESPEEPEGTVPVEPIVPEPKPEPEPEPKPEPEPEPEEAPEENKDYSNTYTVQAGDNLYRIALNHGMDLEVLKSINGLSDNVAEIGMVLKVK